MSQYNTSDNLTKKLLQTMAEDQEGLEHTKRKAENIKTEGIDIKEYEDEYRTIISKAEELERPMGEKIDSLEALMEKYEELKQDDSLMQDLKDMVGEEGEAMIMIDIIDLAREIVSRETINKKLWKGLAVEQHKMVNQAQLAHDESRVKNLMEKMMEDTKERLDRMEQSHEEQLKKREQIYESEIKRQSQHMEKSIQELSDTLNQLGRIISKQSMQNNVQTGQTATEQSEYVQNSRYGTEVEQENQEAKNKSSNKGNELKSVEDLSNNKKKLAEKYKDHVQGLPEDQAWSHQDLADDLGIAKSTVSGYLSQLRNEGYIE